MLNRMGAFKSNHRFVNSVSHPKVPKHHFVSGAVENLAHPLPSVMQEHFAVSGFFHHLPGMELLSVHL